MRTLVHALEWKAAFHLLTTSEAAHVSWDFPTWKIPSKTVVCQSDYANRKYLGDAAFFVTNQVALLRPDYLVLDTVAQGSFGEFLQLKHHAKKTVFINRHKREEALTGSSRQMLRLYDLILTPDYESQAERYAYLEDELRVKNRFVTPIQSYRAEQAWSRTRVREYFGIKSDQKLVYVSAGGGGDNHASSLLESLVESLRQCLDVVTLVGYGPLYRGPKLYRERVIPFGETSVSRYFSGVDAALCAAGYNTFQKLLSAGVPTAFVSLPKGWDAQDERIALAVEQGLAQALNLPLETAQICATLESLLGSSGQQLRHCLRKRDRAEGVLNAAETILRLRLDFRADR